MQLIKSIRGTKGLRLWLTKAICPNDHRLIEVGDIVTTDEARSDLIRGGDALARGWGCAPEILWNGAAALQALTSDSGA